MKGILRVFLFSLIEDVIGLFVGLILSLILAWPMQLLWNWICTDLFALKAVNLFQAWGLSLLITLVFNNPSSCIDDKDV